MKDDFSWTKSIATLVLGVGLLVGALWYTFYIWDDCLEENSWFTCSRMLNK